MMKAPLVCRPTYAFRVAAVSLAVILICFWPIPVVRGQSSQVSMVRTGAVPSAQLGGANKCVVCHPSEVAGYKRTTMAHSLRRAGEEPVGSVTANGSTITMTSSPSGFFQHLSDGGEALDFRVDWVIGSGTHANGYLVNIDDHLFQSPVAYYKSRRAYDLAPGFEHQTDPDFTRPIRQECVLCHSGTALFVPGTLNAYRPPIFPADAESITCERCHGPSEKHIVDPRAETIVNPAKLEPAARDSVCEQCHLFGVARVANPGRHISDFVVGERTEDVFSTYHDANPTGAFKVISHAEQLRLSACARNSEGRLWCGTCHNPHDKPIDAVSYYRTRCLTCHASSFPAAPHPAIQTDCLSCHMPKRDANDGGHTVFTDHRIQRHPQEYPEAPPDAGIVAWREPAPEFRTRNLGIAYIDAGMQRHSGAFILQGYRMLTSIQENFGDDSDFFAWIGQALLIGKQSSEAKFAFERDLELNPNSAIAQGDAASPYILAGDDAGAITHFEKALALDQLDLPSASKLIGLYQKNGRDAEAGFLSARIQAAMKASAQPSLASNDQETGDRAEDAFKNIQVLKNISADQLVASMRFISSSLGVQCSFCHLEGHFEKDDKKPKQIARAMMKMTFALNQNNFQGAREITCYTCHRGATTPVPTPDPTLKSPPVAPENSSVSALSATLPTSTKILGDSVTALGGDTALARAESRVAHGNETSQGEVVPIEVFTESSRRLAIVRHTKGGDASAILSDDDGWTTAPGRPARRMHADEVAAAKLEADLQFPSGIRNAYPSLSVEYPDEIEGRPVWVLVAKGTGPLELDLYFDQATHLLVREIQYIESPLGRNSTQLDFADYRNKDGVEIPYQTTIREPRRMSVIQLDSVQQNVPIDESLFAPPASLPTRRAPVRSADDAAHPQNR